MLPLGQSAPLGTADEIGLTMSMRSKLTIRGKASTLTILVPIKSRPCIWFAQRSKVSNLPFYPPFRAADIPADVFARKMKTVRIHRHRKWFLSRQLSLLWHISGHCDKMSSLLLLRFGLWIVRWTDVVASCFKIVFVFDEDTIVAGWLVLSCKISVHTCWWFLWSGICTVKARAPLYNPSS